MTLQTLSRYTDVSMPRAVSMAARAVAAAPAGPPLPAIEWREVGLHGPAPAQLSYGGPDAPLPAADVVVVTWTNAEWAALNHVFVDSQSASDPHGTDWRAKWHLYAKGVPAQSSAITAAAPPITAAAPPAPLWAYFQVADVPTRDGGSIRVLLLKSDTHLSYSPWSGGLVTLTDQVITETGAKALYSIGTAGGSRDNIHLGDVVVTNAAHAQLMKPDNADSAINGHTCTSIGLFPDSGVWKASQEQLFFPLSELVTTAALEGLVAQLPRTSNLGLDDLLNPAIDPANLKSPSALGCAGEPLLTTDQYYIASSSADSQYSALEMDDAVIGAAAGAAAVPYLFVRNISDPLVPFNDHRGQPIPGPLRDQWSSIIYNKYGAYTSFNGALTTWAIIAAG